MKIFPDKSVTLQNRGRKGLRGYLSAQKFNAGIKSLLSRLKVTRLARIDHMVDFGRSGRPHRRPLTAVDTALRSTAHLRPCASLIKFIYSQWRIRKWMKGGAPIPTRRHYYRFPIEKAILVAFSACDFPICEILAGQRRKIQFTPNNGAPEA